MKLNLITRKYCCYLTALGLLFFCFTDVSYSQTTNRFTLSGQIDKMNGRYVYFSYRGFGSERIWDSALVAGNKFAFKGTLKGQAKCVVAGKKSTDIELNDVANPFFIEAAAIKINLDGSDFKKCVIRGSKIQAELEGFLKKIQPIKSKIFPLDKLYDSIRSVKISETDSVVIKTKNIQLDELREKMAPYYNKISVSTKQFINQHPASLVATDFLRDKMSGYILKDVEHFFYKMPIENQNNPIATPIKAYMASLKIGLKGSFAADFTAKELRGDSIKISDYKGAYILLDFWASWCIPCRADNPELIALYHKYKDFGIEFIGISDNDYQVDKWQDAIEKDGTTIWKHVLRGYLKENNSNPLDISDKYGIHTLPTKILIGPDGKIIERFGPGGIPTQKLAGVLRLTFKYKNGAHKLK